MSSATDSLIPAKSNLGREMSMALKLWNRKLHYYLGLYLLLFVWLFAFTGLLLNHPKWKFDEFWESRKQTTYTREIATPGATGDLGQAREILRQLGISGEIEWTTTRENGNRFEFRVSRPGHILEINADLEQKRVIVHESDLNLWGVMRLLHTFTGVRSGDTRNSRDWVLTSVWAFTMDAVAAGLILMVLSSLYMWYELPQKRVMGASVLCLGTISCGLFCIGLRLLY